MLNLIAIAAIILVTLIAINLIFANADKVEQAGQKLEEQVSYYWWFCGVPVLAVVAGLGAAAYCFSQVL